MDLLLSLYISALGPALDFRPRSSMDNNYAMMSLQGHMGDNDYLNLIKGYMACDEHEWEREMGSEVHLHFIEMLMGTPTYPLVEADFEKLSKLYRINHNRGMVPYKLIELFLRRQHTTKLIWEQALGSREEAKLMCGLLTSPTTGLSAPVTGLTNADLTDFFKACNSSGWGQEVIYQARSYAAKLGGEYEVAILKSVNAV